MSETMTAVPKDDPLMIAWEAYVATPDYANSFKWAGMAEHRKGSMWAAFVAGFLARQPDVKYAGEITNLLRQARDIIAINESVNYDWFVSEINDALAKNPATAIPGTQPAECARYMPGTSGEPDGGAPIAALTGPRWGGEMKLTTLLPWWFRKRTGIGLPPPHVMVRAVLVFPWGTQTHIGKYIPRDEAISTVGDFGGLRAIISGFITFGDGIRSAVLGVYDPRAIRDWSCHEEFHDAD